MTEIFILIKQESTHFIVNYWSDFTIAVLCYYWGQFYQPLVMHWRTEFGAKAAVLFHRQNYAQLDQCIELDSAHCTLYNMYQYVQHKYTSEKAAITMLMKFTK